ncbi:tryptophan synthase subunit alpha [Marinobacter halodurans]|uniref:Tryptophan synthase alpha chain n=1 Tax=Marinobacter halodurans TaxID=2528979 RepID=A0ABY1ZMN5_9GAMM|nr:tryptophan synthase subunit alpha [Marinobacter halodurans]TBW57660.1 tryptophan synthase subunit alpha [Marinobacter halodurans]
MNSTSRLDTRLAATKADKRPALVTYITAGDPDPDTSLDILRGLPEAGADIIELGMPFTDPMADGPAIQKSSLRALNGGQTQKKTLAMVQRFREHDRDTPLVLMGYYNPIYRYGADRFLRDAAEAGVDGLIIVDLPPDHDQAFFDAARDAGIHIIRLVTPTTKGERLKQVLRDASGFVYYVSVAGVTGAAPPTQDSVATTLAAIREHTDLPVGVGFGIRTAEDAAAIGRFSDAVIVGSALVDCVERAESPAAARQALHERVRDLAAGLRCRTCP